MFSQSKMYNPHIPPFARVIIGVGGVVRIQGRLNVDRRYWNLEKFIQDACMWLCIGFEDVDQRWFYGVYFWYLELFEFCDTFKNQTSSEIFHSETSLDSTIGKMSVVLSTKNIFKELQNKIFWYLNIEHISPLQSLNSVVPHTFPAFLNHIKWLTMWPKIRWTPFRTQTTLREGNLPEKYGATCCIFWEIGSDGAVQKHVKTATWQNVRFPWTEIWHGLW